MRPSGSASTACRCAPTSRRARSSASRQPRTDREDRTERWNQVTPSTRRTAPTTMPEVEEAFEEIEVDAPLVGIIMGSKNDKPKMQPAGAALHEAGIRYEVRVMSAHRDPRRSRDYCENARMRGLKVIIAGAGMSAALPGFAAAQERPAGDRGADLGQEPRRPRRAALGGADAARACPSPAWRSTGPRTQDCWRPGSSTRDPRRLVRIRRDPALHARGDRRRLDPAAPHGGLARGRAGRHRRLGRGGSRAPRGRRGLPRAGLVHGRGGRGARADHRPRRRRLRRRRRRVDRRGGPLDPLRAHLLGRARHRAGAAALARRARSCSQGARAYRDALVARALRAPRHPLRRAHPRRPRRADHLRAAAGRLRLRGRPQPRAAQRRLRAARGRQALGRGRHLRLGAARGRGAGDGARSACAREDVSTQVVPRDRHAVLLRAIAIAGGGLERFATEVRNLQRTEVREVEEPFGAGQKGSSAMPHKRNPILTERITGLARVLRGYAQTGLENVALWHERDISHSGAERVVLPDATIVLDYMQHLATRVVEGMTVHAERMQREPGADPRRAVQPAGADGAGRVGDEARRRLPRRPGERPARLGRGDEFRELIGDGGARTSTSTRSSTTTPTSSTCPRSCRGSTARGEAVSARRVRGSRA